MKQLSIMIKPASSLCNLRCRYCFYADVAANRSQQSYGIMRADTAEAVVRHIFVPLEPGDMLMIAFQGGEPTIAGLEWFRTFLTLTEKNNPGCNISYSIQTNAVMLDDNWCAFLEKHDFLVGVSLDGPAKYHDLNRVDSTGKGTYKTVMNRIRLLKQHQIRYNILMTLTNTLARHPAQVWNTIVENDFRYIQFTPCLGELNSSVPNVYELTPDRFASFYIRLFDLWKREFEKGNYYSIKLFDDLINLLAFGEINACGLTGHCMPQIVVEANGSVYPCDFYMLDEWKTGNLKNSSLQEIILSPINKSFAERPNHKPLCETCPYQPICNGACERMRKQICYDKTAGYCGYRVFLDEVITDLQEFARRQRQYRR